MRRDADAHEHVDVVVDVADTGAISTNQTNQTHDDDNDNDNDNDDDDRGGVR